MKANYHTHTMRCGHAQGSDEELIRAAIGQGFDVLGFSDHVPWPYKSGYTHPHVRMDIGQLDEYVATMKALQTQYAGQIQLLVGFECEYFPDYMNWLAEMKQAKQLDYLIFGNHYENSDETGMYFGNSSCAQHLKNYVNSAVKGMETGLFAYIAHPDLFMRRYPKFDEDCRAAARDLIAACKAKNLPMEYNLHDRFRLGPAHGNGYPNRDFFEMAADAGVKMIIGWDAHEPVELSSPKEYLRALEDQKRFGGVWLDSL